MPRTRCNALVDGLWLRERPFGLESSVSTKNSYSAVRTLGGHEETIEKPEGRFLAFRKYENSGVV